MAGAFSGLIKELFTTDEISYKNFLRMDAGAVEELFSRIEVKLTKQGPKPDARKGKIEVLTPDQHF